RVDHHRATGTRARRRLDPDRHETAGLGTAGTLAACQALGPLVQRLRWQAFAARVGLGADALRRDRRQVRQPKRSALRHASAPGKKETAACTDQSHFVRMGFVERLPKTGENGHGKDGKTVNAARPACAGLACQTVKPMQTYSNSTM